MAPRGSVHLDDQDITARRALLDIPEIVDAGDSIEMTAQRPLFDPNDSVEMTAERSPIEHVDADHGASPTDLEGDVIEVEAELPDDLGIPMQGRRPRVDGGPPQLGDEDDSQPSSIPRGIRPRPREFHTEDPPEITAPRAPALGTQKSRQRKALDGPGETFEHIETKAIDDFMEPTGIQQPLHEIEDRPTTNLDPGERGLLAAIAEGSEPSRLKYAEWLHRHGESARAEYLRVDHELAKTNPAEPRFAELVHRRIELASRISVDWRSRVSRSPIEGCAAFDMPCPGRWAALSTTDGDDVRPCGVCRKTVYYCATIQLAQGRVRNGDPVAIDVTCQRWPGDLGGHCVQCNSFVPSEARFCPHCGQSMQLVIHMA
jgi:uncharacterized protein (TIGR02996 family)